MAAPKIVQGQYHLREQMESRGISASLLIPSANADGTDRSTEKLRNPWRLVCQTHIISNSIATS